MIDKQEGALLRLYSTDYLLAHPNGKIIPIVDITVKETNEGSEIGYKIDLQLNFFAVLFVSPIVLFVKGPVKYWSTMMKCLQEIAMPEEK